jgi:hypothetical protein
LKDADTPANGAYDLEFKLFDAATTPPGVQVGPTVDIEDVEISDGLFTVQLDFGDQFNGVDRWLEVAVRPGDSVAAHTVLSPRQWLTPVPYASGLILPYNGKISTAGPAFHIWNTSGDGVTGLCEGRDSVGVLGFVGGFGFDDSGASIGVKGLSQSQNGAGVWGVAQDDVGTNSGVYGVTHSNSGRGVYGYAYDSGYPGSGIGVLGEAESSTGIGVRGWAKSITGQNSGISGQSDSHDGRGVYGLTTSYKENPPPGACGVFGDATATFGYATGVHGQSASSIGRGLSGLASSLTGTNYGVFGQSDSASGTGVYGVASDDAGATFGVRGRSLSTGGRGVLGETTATTGFTYGVWGESASADGRGVIGKVTHSTGATRGVYGLTDSTAGLGVYGLATASTGAAHGVWGQTSSVDGAGLVGIAAATTGGNMAVYGETNSTSGTGVYVLCDANSGTTYGYYSKIDSASGYLFYGNGPGTDAVDFYVDANGDVRADGTYASPAADFAESLTADSSSATLEPGDVVVFGDKPGEVRRSDRASDSRVVGVYSTRPAFLGGCGDEEQEQSSARIPVALVGIVPVKVCHENGPIRIGDMLTSSSMPAHAMKALPRADGNYQVGTILGKAMEDWDGNTGRIQMLVLPR